MDSNTVTARKFIHDLAFWIDRYCGSQLKREVRRMKIPSPRLQPEQIYLALFGTLLDMVPLAELHRVLVPTYEYNPRYCAQVIVRRCRRRYAEMGQGLNQDEWNRRFRLLVRHYLVNFILCLLNQLPELYRKSHGKAGSVHDLFSLNDLELALRTELESVRLQLRSVQGREESAMTAAAC